MPDTRNERVRKKFHILVDGDGIPPPIKSFREMKFPPGYTALPVPHTVCLYELLVMSDDEQICVFMCLQQF